MRIATKTLEAIEEALVRDQGARYRGILARTMPEAGDAYDTKEEDFRSHLGASLIGRECARELWYSFRWTTKPRFEGRMLRLFNRGHLEEARLIALLMLIGMEVWQHDAEGKQFRIHGHRGHFGGGMDGVGRGCPDVPLEAILLEFKTHNAKSFAKLTSEGVLKSKWEHFVQMQLYMGKNGLQWALYVATCKDDDALHMELIQFDPTQYKRYDERAVMIVDATAPPPKIHQQASWYKCKMCDQKDVCHGSKAPEKTCRSCVHIEVGDNGTWWCTSPTNLQAVPLSKDQQRQACPAYTMNPVFKK